MAIPLFVSERSKPQPTTRSLSVGCLIFTQMDQIDFTGPFEVLSRMPDTTVSVVGKELAPVRDVQGLRLTPDVSIAEAANDRLRRSASGQKLCRNPCFKWRFESIRSDSDRTRLSGSPGASYQAGDDAACHRRRPNHRIRASRIHSLDRRRRSDRARAGNAV